MSLARISCRTTSIERNASRPFSLACTPRDAASSLTTGFSLVRAGTMRGVYSTLRLLKGSQSHGFFENRSRSRWYSLQAASTISWIWASVSLSSTWR